MHRRMLVLLVLGMPLVSGAQNAPLGYYRFPSMHGDTIVFTAEGDLWRVPAGGGVAQRLTSHPAEESRAAISPDGQTIAFSASYEGPVEVYTMPLAGGLPKRLTYDSGVAAVVGWTPDGKVLYSTRRFSTLPNSQLAAIDPRTGERGTIPLEQASDGCYEPSGKTLFFTRLPFQGSHTKRYRGGTAQNLWRFTAGAPEAAPLTADYPGTSKTPMAWNGRIYFASDRDGVMNIWSMEKDGRNLQQHTKHADFDVQSPALSGGRIVYQYGADLRLLDLHSGKSSALDIRLTSDFDHMREKWVKKPMDFVSSARLSPAGDRIALTARGQVFIAPAGQGRLVEATRKKGVRYRDARFLPDGKSLIALSDESGEVELWKLPANGVGAAEQLSSDSTILRWEAVPSPDGKWIAHHDKNHRLWMYDVERKTQKRIAASVEDDFQDLRWSPDSRWLAFGETAGSSLVQIKIYNIGTQVITPVTTDRYDSFSPAWSPDGQWLYLLSNRNFQSLVGAPWGSRQPEPFFDRQTKVFQVALRKGLRSPFQPKDELQPETASGKEASGPQKDKKDVPPAAIEIDLTGLQERLIEAPVPPGNYNALTTDGKYLYWLKRETSFEGKQTLESLEIKNDEPKPETVIDDVRSYELSLDGKKLMVRKGSDI